MTNNVATKMEPPLRLDEDLEPIVLSEIPLEGGYLRFRNPLVLSPTWDESGEFLVADEREFGISVSAETYPGLVREVEGCLRRRWRHIANVEDTFLTPRAQALKRRLLARIEVVENA